MAGHDFNVSDIIDKNAIEEVKKLGVEFNNAEKSYTSLAKALAGGIKIDVKSLDDFKNKQGSVNATLQQLMATQNKLAEIQQKQLNVLDQINKKMADSSALNKLIQSMESYTANVNKATDALEKNMSSSKKVEASQQSAASSASSYADAMKKASESVRLASGEYSSIIQSVTAFDEKARSLSVSLVDQRRYLESIKNEIKEAKTQLDAGKISYDQYAVKVGELTQREREAKASIQQTEAVLKSHSTVIISTSGSYQEMNAAILQLEKRFKDLTKAQREGAEGKEMLSNIEKLKTEVKTIDAELGNYQRNVGNYIGGFKDLTGVVSRLSPALGSAVAGVQAFSKGLLKLLANPVVAVIAAIVVVLMALYKAFTSIITAIKGNEEQYAKLQQVLAPIHVLTDAFTLVLQKLGGVLLSVGSALGSVITSMTDYLGITSNLSEKTQEYIKLEELKLAVLKMTRENNEANAKDEAEIAELRDKMMQKESFTAKERQDAVIRALVLEEQVYNRNKRLAEGRIKILNMASQAEKESTEWKDKLSEATVNLFNIETQYSTKKRVLHRQETTIIRELNTEAKKAADERIEIQKNLQDSINRLMTDGIEKQIKIVRTEYKRKIEAIKGNSKDEIALRKSLKEEEIAEIDKITMESEIKRIKKNAESRLAVAKEYSDEELDYKIVLLRIQEQDELREADRIGADKLLITQKYAEKEAEIREDILSKRALKRIELMEKEASKEALGRNSALSNELQELANKYKEGNLTYEKFEKEKNDITKKYGLENARMAVSALEAQYEATKILLSPEERIKMEDRISQAKIALSDAETEAIVDNAKKQEEAQKKALDNVADGISKAGEALSALNDLNSTFFDKRIQKIEEEQEANQSAYDEDIKRIESLAERGIITAEESEARKRAAEDKTAAKEAELAKKKAEQQTRQAKFEKANSLIQSIINTASSIVKTGAELGFPAAIPFIAIAAALGAIQQATIIAQPIPKYAKGTDNHPGGLAVVGDAGKKEAAIFPGGKTWITPAVPTLVDLPKGTTIIPDAMSLNEIKGLVKSDAMLMMEYADRHHDAPIVNVSLETASLQNEIRKGFSENNELRKKQMKQQKRSMEYSAFRSRINNVRM